MKSNYMREKKKNWKKNYWWVLVALGLAGQQDSTSLGHGWQNDPAVLAQNNIIL